MDRDQVNDPNPRCTFCRSPIDSAESVCDRCGFEPVSTAVYDLDLHRALAGEKTEIPPLRVLPAEPPDPPPLVFTHRVVIPMYPAGARRSWLLRLWFRAKLWWAFRHAILRDLLAWQRR